MSLCRIKRALQVKGRKDQLIEVTQSNSELYCQLWRKKKQKPKSQKAEREAEREAVLCALNSPWT